MLHQVAKTREHLAFREWAEGAFLFHRVARACPGLVALVVMPDHIHLLAPFDTRRRLAAVLSGYARWLAPRRGWSGPLWHPLPDPAVVTGDKIWRNERYIHLNPTRAGLVRDPLEWPLSSYLDALGLAVRPVRPRVHSPARYHAYTSADPSVTVEGTDLPTPPLYTPAPMPVVHACSFALRAPIAELGVQKSALRALALASLRALTAATGREIGDLLGMSPRRAYQVPRLRTPGVRIVDTLVDDPRVTPLLPGDLRKLPSWRRYSDRS